MTEEYSSPFTFHYSSPRSCTRREQLCYTWPYLRRVGKHIKNAHKLLNKVSIYESYRPNIDREKESDLYGLESIKLGAQIDNLRRFKDRRKEGKDGIERILNSLEKELTAIKADAKSRQQPWESIAGIFPFYLIFKKTEPDPKNALIRAGELNKIYNDTIRLGQWTTHLSSPDNGDQYYSDPKSPEALSARDMYYKIYDKSTWILMRVIDLGVLSGIEVREMIRSSDDVRWRENLP